MACRGRENEKGRSAAFPPAAGRSVARPSLWAAPPCRSAADGGKKAPAPDGAAEETEAAPVQLLDPRLPWRLSGTLPWSWAGTAREPGPDSRTFRAPARGP